MEILSDDDEDAPPAPSPPASAPASPAPAVETCDVWGLKGFNNRAVLTQQAKLPFKTPPDDPNDHANAGRAVSGSDGAWLSTCGHGYSGAYVHGPHACHSTYATHASHGLPASRFGARGGPTCHVGCVHVCFHGANSPCLVINAQL
eukprot:symbB.v1.2.004622.t1/scaffold255.1/size249928/12